MTGNNGHYISTGRTKFLITPTCDRGLTGGGPLGALPALAVVAPFLPPVVNATGERETTAALTSFSSSGRRRLSIESSTQPGGKKKYFIFAR
jgi:hypothetical protein